ncbi:jg7036 [Pararge aegeria aegeria]|uniref:Jg7036 protein n=1 Tax=Pararge aegeria aegeria TaxID=348720 RepID=A0A8S4RKA0_9NEOP|nr:jg7036 [Pararge aegeria aegeria]
MNTAKSIEKNYHPILGVKNVYHQLLAIEWPYKAANIRIMEGCLSRRKLNARQLLAPDGIQLARFVLPYTFEKSLGASQAPIVPSRLLTDPIELERGLAEAGHDGFGALCEDTTPPSPPPTIIEERLHHRPVASIVAVVPRGALAPAPRPPPLITTSEPQPPPLRLGRYHLRLHHHLPLVNGLLAKSFDQHLKKFSLGVWIKGRIQKAVVLETAHIVRKFLTLEPCPPVAWAFKSPASGGLPLDMAVRGTGEPETLSYEVDLNKDSALGLGITVAGYVCEQGLSVIL